MKPLASVGRTALAATCALAVWPTLCEGAARFSFTAVPDLYPSFSADAKDYVVRCDDQPVTVAVTQPADSWTSVNGGAAQPGTFTRSVSMVEGQSFTLRVWDDEDQRTYHVRCLPSDFPRFTTERPGEPQAQWYVTAPTIPANLISMPPGVSAEYVAIFDDDGAPVWWFEGSDQPLDAKYLSNGHLAWNVRTQAGSEERELDGTLIRRITTVGVQHDFHELLLLESGNYLVMSYEPLNGFDLSGAGGEAEDSIQDAVVQEVTPEGELVWQWRASDHIPASEFPARWRGSYGAPADVYHVNSAEPAGDLLVLSFRHLDAVYAIDRESGAVRWKIGGVATAKSLAVSGDPVFAAGGDFGGQHDARVLADGSLTLFDNGTFLGRPARAVRYRLDPEAGTATLVESLLDPAQPTPLCCGSTRRLAGGDWVTAWGNSGLISELAPDGSRVFALQFDGVFSYRVAPIEPGLLSAATLRSAMDAQVPPNPEPTPASSLPAVSTPAPNPSESATSEPVTATPVAEGFETPSPTTEPEDESAATCALRGHRADRSCTPGAVRRRATRKRLCGRSRSRRASTALRRRVMRRYGIEVGRRSAYRLDWLIPPELGGAGSLANLWPMRAGTSAAAAKRAQEHRLFARVCAGRLRLAEAQKRVVRRWSK